MEMSKYVTWRQSIKSTTPVYSKYNSNDCNGSSHHFILFSVGSSKCWLHSYYNIVSEDTYLKSQNNIVVYEILMAGTY
jgi:hypothetical protein